MKTRVISAIIAVLLLIGIYIFGQTQGLFAICAFVTLGCIREYMRLAFKPDETPGHIRISFVVLCIAIFAGVQAGDATGIVALVLSSIFFLTMVLMTVQKKEDLNAALRLQSMGLLGFLYAAMMPSLTTRLLQIDQGHIWLFGLMAIVFSGDTMAYLVGRQFGKNRLLEAVSPKKSIEGAVGGLIGSGMAGFALSFFVTGQSALILIATAVVTGVFAQVGDLFESLLKRVADVKDSGTMMPGHGGILDRVDGIYFASPVYFFLVRFLMGA